MGLSLREIVAVFDWLGVDRSHGAIWNWTHTLSETQADLPTFTRAKLSCGTSERFAF
jgi:putative transposase